MTTKTVSIVALGVLCFTLQISARQDESVAYPTDYRQWAHVKSTLVGPESPSFKSNGGLHHFYANDKALEGYRTGKFPDGSILIDDLLETQAGKAQGTATEGARRRLAVMVRNEKRYASTGGWGFEVFKADTQVGSLTGESRAACFDCHQSAPRNAVFTELRK
jgi:Cytochrome P460